MIWWLQTTAITGLALPIPPEFCVRDNRERAEELLNEIEDDSSWETTEATVEELTSDEQTHIRAEIEKEF